MHRACRPDEGRLTDNVKDHLPMLALSTGTNNAFPIMMEATVAGMALGLIATGRSHPPTARAKVLHIDVARTDGTRRHEIALVDVCVNTIGEVGSRALWKTDTLRELYCTFAEPGAIGLSAPSVARRAPCSRRSPLASWSRSGSTAASPCDPVSPATSGSHGGRSGSMVNGNWSSVQVTGSQEVHDHLRWRQHLSARDRGPLDHPIPRSPTPPCSVSRMPA
jgi:hypothetical protein